MCDRLNVTKGSFYWHFTDMPAYRSALVEAWASLHDRSRRPFENMPDVDPRERLTVMMQTLVAPQHWALERSMRLWALTDEETRASVERSDRRCCAPSGRRLTNAGSRPDDAALRSLVVFAAGVGLMQSAGPIPDVPAELRTASWTSCCGRSRSGSGGRLQPRLLVEVLQQVVGRDLDVLVPPLGRPVHAGDQSGAVNSAKIPVYEGVSRLRLVRSRPRSVPDATRHTPPRYAIRGRRSALRPAAAPRPSRCRERTGGHR